MAFEHERFENGAYHNVTMLKSFGSVRRHAFFTRVEYCNGLLSFYYLDDLQHAFYLNEIT